MSQQWEQIAVHARRAVMSPVWAAQVLTGAKSFGDNPILGSRRLNELGLHAGRVALAHRLATWRRSRLTHLVSAADRAQFDENGFVLRRDFLPRADFEALVVQTKAYRGRVREMLQGDTVTRRIAFDKSVLAHIPAARAVLDNPEWRGLIRYVGSADAEPMIYLQTILPHVVDVGELDPQHDLHGDTFHPSVKAWLFLTDVAEDDGPFVYVPGSHRLTPQRLAWERRMSIESAVRDRLTRRGSPRINTAALDELGLPPPRTFAVPANSLVVADTFGFHARGTSVRTSVRVELWAYGRRSPFLPWVGFDPWRLTALGLRRAQWHWRIADLIEEAGSTVNVWVPRTDVSAFDPGTVAPYYPLRRRW